MIFIAHGGEKSSIISIFREITSVAGKVSALLCGLRENKL